ncbi:MAG: 2-oxoglutarate dehydrogenase E1 component [Flavobacteriales bacterium]|jgi:2-oxoglutarate dehydrogenase E1 component|nr:2-oxoglutarate dehydrogenase E1 component [Flavobacteriales bacterium]MBT7481983.1 2-oxoglutarate dehydrogenase E1 component [Flavobacteriales bacterium]
MDKFSFLGAMHTGMVEQMYDQFLQNPDSVNEDWRNFFQGFDFAKEVYSEEDVPQVFQKEFKVINLIDAYRKIGHLFTKTNPVRERRKYTPTLDYRNFGLEESDLEVEFQSGEQVGIGPSKLSEIITHLEKVYCQSIGVEYMYIRDSKEIDWIKNRLHKNANTPNFDVQQKKHILHKLNQAVAFENFLHKKFVGQKRFSLEGAESLIPALDALVEHSSDLGVEEFVMGMSHRGRLNVLANIFNKTYKEIFSEFEGKVYEDDFISGDVKYHLGFTSIQKCNNGNDVKLSLSPNPSHLEAVNPVVEGITRAKLDSQYNGDSKKILPILLHGDAALAGQGVVYEVIQMAQLDGYKTGGTIHIAVNNQVGFTTNYLDGRSSTYCTDVAKVTLSPVFHVNGDDVEAVVHALKLAVEYRQKYGKDVFIDLLCYRKYGHNEGDEPRFTQPKLYELISKHPNPREIYKQKLTSEGVFESEIVKDSEKDFQDLLQDRFDESKEIKKANITRFLKEEWSEIKRTFDADFVGSSSTNVGQKKLKELAKCLYDIPEADKLFKKTRKLLSDRKKMVEETDKLDWAMGELLAYASLLDEGYDVRLSGQDVERGTFSHRHAILKVEQSEEEVCPLNSVSKTAKFEAYNSLLSEYGVLGFDYGYSITLPNTLTIWEAQFGDFSNGAQIMLDQFISCAEDKWKVMSGLVMLLPHGYEGQGAEHSSSRLERYLQMCAKYNMQIVNCTTPANFYHVLRRQLKREYRKPLVVFTPKSLLRHPKCVSSISDLADGKFEEIIDDTINSKTVEKLVLCSGKIYYELLDRREKEGTENVALVRLEQIYPLDIQGIIGLIEKYDAKELLWVQEEPENMGAWTFILSQLRDLGINVISRTASAATASGSSKRSASQQREIIDKVFK